MAALAIAWIFQQIADGFATPPAVLLYEAHTGDRLLGSEGGVLAIKGLITAIAGFTNAIVLLPLVWFTIRWRVQKPAFVLGYRRCRPQSCALWVGGGAVLFLAALGGGEVARDTTPAFSAAGLRATAVWPWVLYVSLVVVIPLVEETIYRGFLVATLQRRSWHQTPIAIVSAVAWTASHGQYAGYDLLVLMALGLLLGAARLRSGSILPALLVHSAWNAAALLLSG